MHYLELGGAEISLIGLMQALDNSKYDVDLFIHRHQGELMHLIAHILIKIFMCRDKQTCVYPLLHIVTFSKDFADSSLLTSIILSYFPKEEKNVLKKKLLQLTQNKLIII